MKAEPLNLNFIKSEFPELSELKNIENEFIKAAIKAKETLMIKVLKQLLKRNPDLEDFKRCTLYNHTLFPNVEILEYSGIKIGAIITKDWTNTPSDKEFKNILTFTFDPERASF